MSSTTFPSSFSPHLDWFLVACSLHYLLSSTGPEGYPAQESLQIHQDHPAGQLAAWTRTCPIRLPLLPGQPGAVSSQISATWGSCLTYPMLSGRAICSALFYIGVLCRRNAGLKPRTFLLCHQIMSVLHIHTSMPPHIHTLSQTDALMNLKQQVK